MNLVSNISLGSESGLLRQRRKSISARTISHVTRITT